jgi:hypothetical protein
MSGYVYCLFRYKNSNVLFQRLFTPHLPLSNGYLHTHFRHRQHYWLKPKLNKTYGRGAHILLDCKIHLKIRGARRVKLHKFHTEDPQIIEPKVQTLVATATCRPGFLQPLRFGIYIYIFFFFFEELSARLILGTYINGDVVTAATDIRIEKVLNW